MHAPLFSSHIIIFFFLSSPPLPWFTSPTPHEWFIEGVNRMLFLLHTCLLERLCCFLIPQESNSDAHFICRPFMGLDVSPTQMVLAMPHGDMGVNADTISPHGGNLSYMYGLVVCITTSTESPCGCSFTSLVRVTGSYMDIERFLLLNQIFDLSRSKLSILQGLRHHLLLDHLHLEMFETEPGTFCKPHECSAALPFLG